MRIILLAAFLAFYGVHAFALGSADEFYDLKVIEYNQAELDSSESWIEDIKGHAVRILNNTDYDLVYAGINHAVEMTDKTRAAVWWELIKPSIANPHEYVPPMYREGFNEDDFYDEGNFDSEYYYSY